MKQTNIELSGGEPSAEDKAAMEQRQIDTAAWLDDPTNQAAMAEGRRALEMEMAEAAKQHKEAAKRRKADIETDAETDIETGEFDAAETSEFGVTVVSVTEAPPVWTAKAKMAVPPADPLDEFSVGQAWM
jgi:hypothetical protein